MKSKRSKLRRRNVFRITGATLTALLVLYSCQKENVVKEESLSRSTSTANPIDCERSTIQIGGPYFEKTDSKTLASGSKVEVIYFNTETDFVIKVKSTQQIKDLHLDGIDIYNSKNVSSNKWITYSFPLDLDWQGCDKEFHVLKVIGEGENVELKLNYALVGLSPN